MQLIHLYQTKNNPDMGDSFIDIEDVYLIDTQDSPLDNDDPENALHDYYKFIWSR
jgi:hypothetical protein